MRVSRPLNASARRHETVVVHSRLLRIGRGDNLVGVASPIRVLGISSDIVG